MPFPGGHPFESIMGTLTLDDLHYTYEDYAQWPGDWELIEGVPVAMTPAPGIEHQLLASELIRLLGNQVVECPECRVLGETDYKINEETVVRPDVLVVRKPVGGAYLAQRPELIVEVVSPSTARRDERVKLQLYAQQKVPYYLLAYPQARRMTVYHLQEDGYDKVGDFTNETLTFEALPCPLSLDCAQAFRVLDR